MKPVLFPLLFLCLLSASESPRIDIPQTTVNIGKHYAGAQVPITYTVTNRGTAPLRLSNVGAGCGCLAPQRSWPETLAPSASGTIALTVDTRDLEGAASHPLTVFSNDPKSPKFTVYIQVDIERVFLLTPSSIAFGEVSDTATSARRSITIKNSTIHPLAIQAPRVSDPRFKATLKEQETGKLWLLEVEMSGNLAYGMNAVDLVLPTNHPGVPRLTIQTSAWRQLPLQVIPPRLTFAAPVRQTQTRVLVLRGRPAEKWTILSVKCTDPRVIVEPKGTDAAGLVRITVTVPESYTLAPGQGESIDLECRSDTDPSTTVPLHIPVTYLRDMSARQ